MTCKCIGWCIIVRLFNVILVTCPPSIFILSVSARGTPFILRYSCIFPVRSGFLLLVHQQNSLSLPVTLDIVVFWKQIHSLHFHFAFHTILLQNQPLQLLLACRPFHPFHLRMIHFHSFLCRFLTYPFACFDVVLFILPS
jgi:hypothetical protein